MKGELVGIVTLIVIAIIFGLVLRFGATSVPLGGDVTNIVDTGFSSLTLANPKTYPYEGPKSG